MNHIYRTVWNEITRSFVAAAETVKSHGKRASSKSCTASAESAVGAAPARRGLVTSRLNLMRLEPRLVFDGAAVDTVLAVDAYAQEQQTPVAETEATPVAAQPVTTTDTREAALALEGSAPYTALLLTAADPAQRSSRVEIAFVEDNVVGWQTIIADIPAGIEIVKLDSRGNGLQQMSDYLAGRDDIDAIHIFSHGSDDLIKLGTAQVSNDTLVNYAEPLNQIGSALNEQGDILLYGCNIAKSDAGAALVTSLAALTQADVAASNDNTGNAARGGDWALEVKTGNLDQEGLALSSFDGLLVAPTLQKITANGKTLTLTYDQELDSTSTPYAEDFAVIIQFKNGGHPYHIVGADTAANFLDDMVTVDGKNVYLTLEAEMEPEDADRVTVSYTPGVNRIKTLVGADEAASFDGANGPNAQVMSAGASWGKGNLWVNVLHDGAIVIDRCDGTDWNTQFYDNDYQLSDSQINSSYFQTSSGSLIEFTSGGVTQTIALGSYLNQAGVTGVAPSPDQSKNYNDLFATWTVGDLEITQKVTLPSDTAQQINIQWSARNTGTTEITNLRFVHAVDSYLSGGDNGAGEWDAATNTISVYRTDAGVMQRMSLQGVTVPYSAESQDYDTVATDAIAGFGATPVVDVTIADWDSDNSTPNSYPDNGYGMEWKTATLAAGQSWTIDAVESFVAATAIVTGGDTAAVVTDGTRLTLDFTVENAATTDTLTGYTVQGVPSGWTFELQDSAHTVLFTSSSPIQNASETIQASTSSTLHLIVTPADNAGAGTTTITLKATTTAGQDFYVSQGTATITVPNHAPVLSAEVLPADEIPAITYAAANEVAGGDPGWFGLNPTPPGYDNATRVVTGPWAKDTNGAPSLNSSCYFTAESGTILANVAYTNFSENSLGVYLTSSGAAANTDGNGTFTLTFVEPSKDLSIRCFYSLNTHFTAEVLGVDGTTVLQTIYQPEPNSDSNVWLHINRPTAEVGAIRFTAERAAGTDGSTQGTWGVGVQSVIRQPITVNPLVLADIAEDDSPSNGTQISDLLPASRLYDRDYANPAVGISAVDTTHGTWEYKLNSSNTWAAFDFSANSGKALLLGQYDRVRFVSNADFSGTVSDGITVHAWDQTAGTAGSYLTIAGNTGGNKTLSVATGTASILVTPVNDAPTINGLATGSTSNAASFTEVAGADDGSAAVSFTDGTTVITDNDSATLSSLTVSIDSSTLVAGDELKLGSDLIDLTDTSVTGVVTYGTTVFAYAVGDNNTARTITFTVSSGSGAKADFQLLLNALSYNHSGDAPVDGSTRTFSVLVTDDQGDSGPYGTPAGYLPRTGADDPFGGAQITANRVLSPTLVDIDGDGDLDVVVGVHTYDSNTGPDSQLKVFINTPANGQPVFAENANHVLASLNLSVNAGGEKVIQPAPTFVDFDGDGDLDMIVGGTKAVGLYQNYGDWYWDNAPNLQFFENNGTSFVEVTGQNNPLAGVLTAISATPYNSRVVPVLGDIDGDGDLDLIIGFNDDDQGDRVMLFTNTAASGAPVFDGGVDLPMAQGQSFSMDDLSPAPILLDFDGDGDLDVLIPDYVSDPTPYSYNYAYGMQVLANDGTGVFSNLAYADNPFRDLQFNGEFRAVVADIDGDGDLEVIAGDRDYLSVLDPTEAVSFDFTVTLVASSDVVADTTAPVFSTASVTGNIVTLQYGEALNGTLPAASAFNISMNGVANAVTGVTIDSNDPTKLNLTLTKAVAFGKTLTVAYTNPGVDNAVATNAAIQDAAGNDAANFSNVTLSSSTAATTSFSMTSVVQPSRAVTISVPNGLSINEVVNTAASSSVPKTVKLPLGQFGFEISGVAVGGTASLSMELDANLKSLGYYKQNLITGKWDNIATSATVNTGTGKATVNFSLVDGGAYDADRIANGVIVDPGGAGENSLLPYVLENTTDVGTVVLVNTNQVNGTITYELTGGDDQANFRIDPNTGALVFVGAPNFEAPTDTGEGTGNNTYTVQATIRGSNGGSERQNLVVTVINVLEAGETPGVSTFATVSETAPVVTAPPYAPPLTTTVTAELPVVSEPLAVNQETAEEPLATPPAALSQSLESPPPSFMAEAPTQPNLQPSSRSNTSPVAQVPGTAAPAPGTPLSLVPGLTAAEQGGFQVALVARPAAGGDILVVNRPLGNIVIAAGERISVSIPAQAFAHTSAAAVVTLSAQLADGAPLPAWMRFNPLTGTFEGTPPPGFKGELAVRVVARDKAGREAVQVFRIGVGMGRGEVSTERGTERDTERSGNSEPAAPRQPQASQRGALFEKMGKPSLAKQFDRHGMAARHAETNELIVAARKAAEALSLSGRV